MQAVLNFELKMMWGNGGSFARAYDAAWTFSVILDVKVCIQATIFRVFPSLQHYTIVELPGLSFVI
jgi:hypothetical protein